MKTARYLLMVALVLLALWQTFDNGPEWSIIAVSYAFWLGSETA